MYKLQQCLLRVGSRSFQNHALHETCHYGQHELVALILKKGIDINLTNKDGVTALHHAVRNAKIEVCKLLITSNCDLDRKNHLGNTDLHEAHQVKCLNLRIKKILLKLLLENGACPKIKNNDDYTPRQSATMKRYHVTFLSTRRIYLLL